MKPKIGIGFRIGKLTVSEPTGERKNGYMVWNCTCDCGGAVQLDTRTLQRGTVRDCGCETKLFYGFDASLEDMETVNDDGRVGECRLDYAVHAVREVHRNFLHGIALVFRKLEQHLHYFV